MIPDGTIFQLGTNFQPRYLHKAVVEVKGYHNTSTLEVEILRMETKRQNGRFYVGGSALIPEHLVPRDVREQVAA